MLHSLVLTVHIIVCLVLIAVILLQAGRGGGVADVGSAPSVLGTQGTTLLTRATTACAVIFMLTSMGLAMLSSQRSKSLMADIRPKPVTVNVSTSTPVKTAAPAATTAADNSAPVQKQTAPAEKKPAS